MYFKYFKCQKGAYLLHKQIKKCVSSQLSKTNKITKCNQEKNRSKL